MSTSRRQFILGTAAGLILPSYYDKVFTFFENHGEPLLELPASSDIELFAVDWGNCGPQLHLGDPHTEPPEMTIREFAERYCGGTEQYLEEYGYEESDLDSLMDYYDVLDTWIYNDAPAARAYRLLEDMDLGPDLSGEDSVGEIRFIDGVSPGNDSFWCEAADEVSLSLLQKRLNELNTGIRVTMA